MLVHCYRLAAAQWIALADGCNRFFGALASRRAASYSRFGWAGTLASLLARGPDCRAWTEGNAFVRENRLEGG